MRFRYILILLLAGLSALSVSARPGDDGRFLTAVQLYAAGNPARAAEIFGDLTQEDPADDASWYYLGLCRIAGRDHEGAREALERAAALDSSNYWYRSELARAWAASGDIAGTIARYEALLADYPKKTEIQYTLLSLYAEEGDLDKTLGCLDAIEGYMGKSDATVMTRFDILRQQGDIEAAYGALEDYVAEYSSIYVLTLLGDHESSMFNDSTALAYYGQALSLDKDYAPACLGVAEVYRLNQHYPEYFSALDEVVSNPNIDAEAKNDYLMAVIRHTDPRFQITYQSQLDSALVLAMETHPADTSLLRTAGSFYVISDRLDKAAEIFRRNVEMAPNSLSAAATYVQVLFEMEDWDGVIRQTETFHARFPEEPALLTYQNFALYNKGDYPGVVANCERILKLWAGDKDISLSALSLMGDMYHTLGDKKKAYKAYDRALKLDDSYAPVLNNYAWYLCLEGKKLKKAYEMSKKTVEQEPDNVTYLDTFGWILHLMKKDLEAKPFFKHAMLYGGKENKMILLHYARVLEVLGETDLATSYRTQAANLKSEDE